MQTLYALIPFFTFILGAFVGALTTLYYIRRKAQKQMEELGDLFNE